MTCDVCQSEVKFSFLKTLRGEQWRKCGSCSSIISEEYVEQIIGGDASEERNEKERNEIRLDCIASYSDAPIHSLYDYGCGKGNLVRLAWERGIEAIGFDENAETKLLVPDGYNPFHYYSKKHDVITMIEVIEHLEEPFILLRNLGRRLRDNGILYIETSFTDGKTDEELCKWDYVDSGKGHVTIYSQEGLWLLLQAVGFKERIKVNDNTFILRIW